MASLSDQSTVIGGALTGMSAAKTVLENGGSVVLLDKSFFCGGKFDDGQKRNLWSPHKGHREIKVPNTQQNYSRLTL